MTDISNLKPGDAPTYEQAMALPDGAVVSLGLGPRNRYKFVTPLDDGKANSLCGINGFLVGKKYWIENGGFEWHSARLESLPEPAKPERRPILDILADPNGPLTGDSNTTVGVQFFQPAKPELDTAKYTNIPQYTITAESRLNELQCGKCGATFAGDVIHECAKRQASEIEKEAARHLVAARSTIHSGIGTSYKEIAQKCVKYIEAYDYAKSIGAIE